jgi:hypothetical protein
MAAEAHWPLIVAHRPAVRVMAGHQRCAYRRFHARRSAQEGA